VNNRAEVHWNRLLIIADTVCWATRRASANCNKEACRLVLWWRWFDCVYYALVTPADLLATNLTYKSAARRVDRQKRCITIPVVTAARCHPQHLSLSRSSRIRSCATYLGTDLPARNLALKRALLLITACSGARNLCWHVAHSVSPRRATRAVFMGPPTCNTASDSAAVAV